LSCPLCSNNLNGRLRRIEGVEDAINLETSFEFSFLLQHVCYQSVIPPGRKTIG